MTTEKDAPDTAEEPTRQVTGFKLMARASVVSGMTLLSRILGLARDIVFARFFGASLVMDAFLVANRIPNMLRRFFAEGAFSQGFVPVMARYRERHDHEDAREFVDSIAGTFGLTLFVVTLAGVVAAPLLVAIVAPGFIGEDGRFDLATLMLRFTFPYLFFVSLTAFAGGILNTYGRFAVPAFTPVILNIVLIAGAIWLSPMLEEPGMALAYAVFVAGVLQLLFQVPFLLKIRALPRPKWAPAHDGVRRAAKLMLPAIIRLVGCTDQRVAGRHHRVAAGRRQNQPAVLLRSADGVSVGIIRYRARDGHAYRTCRARRPTSHTTSSRTRSTGR